MGRGLVWDPIGSVGHVGGNRVTGAASVRLLRLFVHHGFEALLLWSVGGRGQRSDDKDTVQWGKQAAAALGTAATRLHRAFLDGRHRRFLHRRHLDHREPNALLHRGLLRHGKPHALPLRRTSGRGRVSGR